MEAAGAHLAFWSAALADLVGVVVCAVVGVRRIRRGEVAGHRRMMLSAAGLVALFLAAYAGKVLLLGREDRSLWDRASLLSLYVHETCVLVMLLAGAYAGYRAFRFRADLVASGTPAATHRRDRAHHRFAGRTAVAASLLALATACGVLAGMYARALG